MTTRTRNIAAGASAALVLLAATLWWISSPRTTHEIVLPPVMGAQR
jgi:hypothetical protein